MHFFVYKGSPLCMMSAFKQQCGFGFWLSKKVVGEAAEDGMDQFGKLISIEDLPPAKQPADFVHKAMAVNAGGVNLARTKPAAKTPPDLPVLLALEFEKKKNLAARSHYLAMTAGKQRGYLQWISEAKTEATRQRRLASTLEWLSEGMARNWKYEKC